MVMPLNLNRVAQHSDRMTDDEFYSFCQANRHLRIEREADGQIIFEIGPPKRPTNTKTGLRNFDIALEVGIWNKQYKLGYATDSSGGYTLPNSAVRAPDVAWFTRERWEALAADGQEKFARICPDFVIELMSDKDEKYTLPKKMDEYLANGVRLGWMIDPFQQQTTVFRPDQEPETVAFSDDLTGHDVLVGFVLRLSELGE
jgi:Uma2 family endonuclease